MMTIVSKYLVSGQNARFGSPLSVDQPERIYGPELCSLLFTLRQHLDGSRQLLRASMLLVDCFLDVPVVVCSLSILCDVSRAKLS